MWTCGAIVKHHMAPYMSYFAFFSRHTSDSDVRYVTSYGLQYGRMSSTLGKIIQVCSERFLWSQSDLLGKNFDKRHVLCSLSKQKGC